MFRLGHISDVHLAPVPTPRKRQLMSKRIIGYSNWRKNREKAMTSESLDGGIIVSPLLVGAGEVSLKHAVRSGFSVEDEGDGIGLEAARAHRDERPQRVGPDQGVLDVEAILAEMRRRIHRGLARFRTACADRSAAVNVLQCMGALRIAAGRERRLSSSGRPRGRAAAPIARPRRTR